MLDRAVVRQAPPAATVEDAVIQALEFDDPAAPELQPAQEDGAAVAVRGGALEVVNDPDDHLVNAVPLAVPRDEVGDILIRARADKGSYLRLAWATAEGPRGGRAAGRNIWLRRIDVRFNDTKGFHTYVVNARNVLKRGLKEGESLGRLYVQPADVAGAKVEIDFVRFVSKASHYAEAPHGVDYETLGGEMRRVLFMRPEQTLEFALRVPARAPRLDFGMGVLLDGRPLRFAVTLTRPDGAEVPLHEADVGDTEGWRDARVDLARWAGREVRLSLHVAGDRENVAFWSSPTVSGAPAEPFNVVVLVEDAERADYLSLYGHPAKTTPFKERLMAERGVLFEHAIAQADKTRPSVASYMTSLYPSATGSWQFSDVLSERHLTLAEILRAQGYATASFLQNGNAGPYAGLHQGFDRLRDESASGRNATEDAFLGEGVTRWLEEHEDRNFFLYLHAVDPHAPYNPPSPYRDRYAARIPKGGMPVQRDLADPSWVEPPTVESRRLLYEAEVEHNDRVVETFFARLEAMGLADTTLVVMMSDHGEYLGERGLLGNRLWGHNPPGYMIGTRVPFMLVYPERFPEAKRVKEPVQLIDVMPTVLELAGVDRADLLLRAARWSGWSTAPTPRATGAIG
jgi:hypothetical protein